MVVRFKRIAVTVPPAEWFSGIATTMYEMYRQGLIELGFELFDVPVDVFLAGDQDRVRSIVRQLKAFQPEAAIGLPKGAYALLCRMPPRRDGFCPNVFTDVLDIPTICLWDHAPFELVDQLLAPLPASPADSAGGTLQRLRDILSHPRLAHWSPDGGQTTIMLELDLVQPQQVLHELLPALPGFERSGQSFGEHADHATPRVAFVGHLNQHERESNDRLEQLSKDIVHDWCAEPTGRPLWTVLGAHLATVSAEERERLALTRDETFFWRFAHTLTIRRAQTALRLQRLAAVPGPVACYGNLEAGAGVASHLIPVRGHIPFGPLLAKTLARHDITVDVMNPGSIHGFSHKPGMTFGSGGFALVDRKAHFIEAFGEAGDAVSYGSNDELATKVDHYLSRPAERREVGDAIRAILRERFGLPQVLARVLSATSATSALTSSGIRTGDDSLTVENLLPHLRAEAYWQSTLISNGDGLTLTTSGEAWGYAAHVPVTTVLADLHEPHVAFDVIVQTGSLGISMATGDPWQLSREQVLGPTVEPERFLLELPDEGVVRLLLRSGPTAPTRVELLGIRLCERARR